MFNSFVRLAETCGLVGVRVEVEVRAARPLPRPAMVENLEGRTLLSASLHHAPVGGGGAPAAAIDMPVQHVRADQLTRQLNRTVERAIDRGVRANQNVLPLKVTGVKVENGQLVLLGKLGKHAFTAPITLTTEPNPANADCPILNLEVGAIHLDVLGLNVDTSDICLRVTAEPGDGNLLGNLLCGVAGLLDDGLPLGGVLGGLTSTQLTGLTSGLTDLLNGVFGRLTSGSSLVTTPGGGGGAGGGGGGGGGGAGDVCDILSLSLGPVDLNLLGLDVELDDCDGGPVTVDVTAEEGPGNLLGNLLCGLTGALDGGISLGQIINRVNGLLNRGA